MMLLNGFVFALACHVIGLPLNNRPIIGLLDQDLAGTDNHTYIAASYVKYLESAGARVVPILTSQTAEEVSELFNYINGVFFPGGGIKWFTSGYYHNARIMFDLAIEANKKGDHFPVWGTCLGFETLHVLRTNTTDVLGNFSADDIAIALNYTEDAYKSRLFGGMRMELYKQLGSEGISYNHHRKGVSPLTYKKRSDLNNFYKILSTNVGRKGHEFVSSIEAIDYPIYGLQWHPEKNNFEYNTREQIPHSESAVHVSEYFANFFVDEARRNRHSFPSVELEQSHLIYNYQPVFSGSTGSTTKHNFEQIYIFPKTK